MWLDRLGVYIGAFGIALLIASHFPWLLNDILGFILLSLGIVIVKVARRDS